ncbi:MAG: phosphatase PAP2 family protein [Acidobacteria bacterium]|nr:phosphatase PAP2 family protein [Acidobacteriota bacterium]
MKPLHRTETIERSDAAIILPWRDPAPYRTGRNRIISGCLAAVATWLREAVASCGAFEWVGLGYLGVSSVLIAIFHGHLPRAWGYLVVQAGVAALILALSRAAANSAARAAGGGRPSRVIVFIRSWYPQALFLFCFEELHYLVHLIFPGWFDRWLIAFDHWLVGVHPTVWLEQFASPALNDFMQMAYITYFFYLTILGAILYRREEHRAFWAVMTSSITAYSMGYVISIVFPIESPFHALAALQRVELTGGFFTSLIGLVERFGRVHGAAFPSAHVSGSCVALLGAWRYRRWLFWIFLPFFLAMLVSTVYGRYHYIADVLGGLVVGAVGFGLGHRLMWIRGAWSSAPFRAPS